MSCEHLGRETRCSEGGLAWKTSLTSGLLLQIWKKTEKEIKLIISTKSISEEMYDAIEVALLPRLQVSQLFCNSMKKADMKYNECGTNFK